MDFSKFIEAIKLPPILLFGISLASAIFLFVPDQVLSLLSILEFRNQYKSWIGIIFVLSVGLFAGYVLNFSRKAITNFFSRWKIRRQGKDRLKKLTPKEKTILRAYIEPEMRTRYWMQEDGIVRGLEQASILYQASTSPNWARDGLYAFNINDWAWDELTKNPKLTQEEED